MACGGVLTDLVTLCLVNGGKGQEAVVRLPGWLASDMSCKAQPLLQRVQRLHKEKKTLALHQWHIHG